jgi:hypothetical protein
MLFSPHKMQKMASALTFSYSDTTKIPMNFSIAFTSDITWVLILDVETNKSQSSACIHIHQKSGKNVSKSCLTESWCQLFSGTGK